MCSTKVIVSDTANISKFGKGLINLALNDWDKWNKTAHAKSYIVDTSTNMQNIFSKRKAVLHF